MNPREPGRTIRPEDAYRPAIVEALFAEHAHDIERATWRERLASTRAGLARVGGRLAASRWAKPAAKGLAFLALLGLLAGLGVLAGGGPRLPLANAGPAHLPSATASATPEPVVAPATAPADPTPSEPTAPKGILDDGRVVLNVATEDELTKLPHVGPKRARAIVALRAKLGGRFKAITDLLRVKGLGRKTVAKLAPKVVLDPPKG